MAAWRGTYTWQTKLITFFFYYLGSFFNSNVFLLKLLEGIWPLNPKTQTGCGLLAELREMLQPLRLWCENGFRTEHKDQVLKYLQPSYVMSISADISMMLSMPITTSEGQEPSRNYI